MNKSRTNEIIEVYGVIATIFPVDMDNSQKIIIDNAAVLNSIVQVEPRILLIVKQPFFDNIDFKVGLPITAKGVFSRRKSADFLSILHTAHAPIGFIRYDGKVYR